MSERTTVGISVNFPGAKRPLEEGEKLGWWKYRLIESGNYPEFGIPNVDTYVLAAWHPVYDEVLRTIPSEKRIGILWTSSVGEMGFEPVELSYLEVLVKHPRVDFIWFGEAPLARLYPEKGFFCGYPMSVELKPKGLGKRDIITLFCPSTHKKNILNQLMAVRLFQENFPKFTLHTNVELPGRCYANKCVHHVWLPQAEYRELIETSKINMACSWAETFNYQVAEAALLGTPSVTSSTVPVPGIQCSRPNCPEAIAICMEQAWDKMDKAREQMVPWLEQNNTRVYEVLRDKGIAAP